MMIYSLCCPTPKCLPIVRKYLIKRFDENNSKLIVYCNKFNNDTSPFYMIYNEDVLGLEC